MAIIRADAMDLLDHVEPGTVQCAVTSPPYWGLRSYGDDPAEGGRQDLHEYLEWLVDVFARVRSTLVDDGALWVNIGDTAAGSGGAGGDYLVPNAEKRKRRKAPIERREYRQGRATVVATSAIGFDTPTQLAGQQWCSVPDRLKIALQNDGWRVRADITWSKVSRHGKAMLRPESLDHANRPGVSSERILLFQPGPGRMKWRPERLQEKGDVWSFPPVTGRFKGAAPFPRELARRCIAPSTDPGDLVLDPFSGSGTTCRTAESMGRRAIGLDLYAPEEVAP